MAHLPLLEDHVEQALGLTDIWGIQDAAYLSGHRRALIALANIALHVKLQVKLAALDTQD